MRITRELKEQQVNAFVFTGDGKTEARHLIALCRKLNGNAKSLWFPKVPLTVNRKVTGLHALKLLRGLIVKYELSRFLFLIDREHFSPKACRKGKESEEARDFLEKEIRVRIDAINELTPRYTFLFNGSLGSKSFELCLAIRGVNSNAEEEEALLIHLKLGAQVEPVDYKIRRFLRNSGISEEGLITGSSIGKLKKAFPGLCGALEWV